MRSPTGDEALRLSSMSDHMDPIQSLLISPAPQNEDCVMPLSRRTLLRTAAASSGAALLPSMPRAQGQERSPATVDYQDWDAVRRLFALSPGHVHAALFFLSSHPLPVREAVQKHRDRL